MKKVGIVGFGHVGHAIHQLLVLGTDMYWYDPNGDSSWSKEDINKCDLAIICVPTPPGVGGSCDISIVEESVKWLETPLILIKSTVPPGTTSYLAEKYKKRVCFSPEYYGESNYWIPEEWGNPKAWPFLIIGGNPRDTEEIVKMFVPILGPMKTYWQTDAVTAELVKYMENSWLATQVIFANEFYQIAKALGVDFYELRELWALDPRVAKSHTTVFPENRGFSGKCLPKDLSAIIECSKKAGYSPELLEEVKKSNKKFRAEAKKL